MITAIKHIRSKKFTRKIPARGKFRLGQTVKLRTLTNDQHFLTIYKENKPGKRCKVVGMQRNTTSGQINPMNRYYVRFANGRIYWAPSGHLMPVNQTDKDKGKSYTPDTPAYKQLGAQIAALKGQYEISINALHKAEEEFTRCKADAHMIYEKIAKTEREQSALFRK